jgi:hypothetical protein
VRRLKVLARAIGTHSSDGYGRVTEVERSSVRSRGGAQEVPSPVFRRGLPSPAQSKYPCYAEE